MSEELLWRKNAFWLMAVFVAGFFIVLAFAVRENARREKLERIEFTTIER
jgi:hypothetical protein